MKQSALRDRLEAGEAVLGTFIHLGDPAVVEIAGAAGFDFVICDTEHSSRDPSTIENMVRAAEAFGIAALIRVHENDEKAILRALETGAQGIVLPFVRSADDVRRAQQAMWYPPDGNRGTCTVTRAARYGALRPDFATHAAECNRELLLVGLIEDAEGVDHIEEIMDAGLDVAFVARGDLTAALGVSAQSEHPLVLEAVEKVIAAAAELPHQWSGIMPYDPEEGPMWATRGCSFLACSIDTYILWKGFRAFTEAMSNSMVA